MIQHSFTRREWEGINGRKEAQVLHNNGAKNVSRRGRVKGRWRSKVRCCASALWKGEGKDNEQEVLWSKADGQHKGCGMGRGKAD